MTRDSIASRVDPVVGPREEESQREKKETGNEVVKAARDMDHYVTHTTCLCSADQPPGGVNLNTAGGEGR